MMQPAWRGTDVGSVAAAVAVTAGMLLAIALTAAAPRARFPAPSDPAAADARPRQPAERVTYVEPARPALPAPRAAPPAPAPAASPRRPVARAATRPPAGAPAAPADARAPGDTAARGRPPQGPALLVLGHRRRAAGPPGAGRRPGRALSRHRAAALGSPRRRGHCARARERDSILAALGAVDPAGWRAAWCR
jgi:hypothetical protein